MPDTMPLQPMVAHVNVGRIGTNAQTDGARGRSIEDVGAYPTPALDNIGLRQAPAIPEAGRDDRYSGPSCLYEQLR